MDSEEEKVGSHGPEIPTKKIIQEGQEILQNGTESAITNNPRKKEKKREKPKEANVDMCRIL